jgi:transcriptional regulator of arginine metabolism
MIDTRSRRQQALAQLLRSGAGTSQDELVTALRALGFTVTQATVSRDLDQIGAMRSRRGYALPDQPSTRADDSLEQLRAIAAQWVRSIDPAGQLVVIRTPPGCAHLVGVALDRAQLDGAVGTICGDDTLFVASTGGPEAQALARALRLLAGLEIAPKAA